MDATDLAALATPNVNGADLVSTLGDVLAQAFAKALQTMPAPVAAPWRRR